MIQLVMCLVHWNEESIDFNGCPSPWKGIVGNGANVARVFLDHQGLSTDVDLSVSLNLTILVKPHREKASSRIVDRRQYPMYYSPHFIDRDTKFQSITRICDDSRLLGKQQLMEEHGWVQTVFW